MSKEPEHNDPDIADDADHSAKERQRVFVLMLKTHEGIVGKIVRKYSKSREDSVEMTQEIVANLWGSFAGFRNEAKITTWVYSVARNTMQKYLRSKRYQITFTGQTLHENDLATTEDVIKVNMNMDMEQLNHLNKQILKLIDEGFTYAEIAGKFKISVNALRSRMTRFKNENTNTGSL